MNAPCPQCGTVNQPNARFCKQCGYKFASITDPLSAPKPQPQQTPPMPVGGKSTAVTITCPNCGTVNRMTAKFCQKCRASLTVPMQGPPPVVPPPVQQPQPPPAAQSRTPPPMPPPAQPQANIPAGGIQTVQLPQTKPRGTGSRWALIIPPIILVLCALMLCGSLSGVYVYESGLPTPTLMPTVPTETPSPTDTPEPTETPTLTDTPIPPTDTPTVPPSPTPITPEPPTATPPPNPPYPVGFMQIREDGRFGFATTIGDPDNPLDDNKPLTYRLEGSDNPADGRTNSIRVWVDGETPNFGGSEGTWISQPALNADNSALQSLWEFKQVQFSEKVGVVLNPSTNRIGIMRIEFQAENLDSVSHDVGLRLMIDTLIGDNDGVPFILPNQSGVITAPLDLANDAIPGSFQVIETKDPTNPGVVVQFTLAGEDATKPNRLLLSSWCRADWAWDYYAEVGGPGPDFVQCQGKGNHDDKQDSAVGLYWDAQPLGPGETRSYVVYYGLGEFKKVVPGAQITLGEIAPQYNVGDHFYVTALVKNPQAGQTVRLDAPPEFALVEGAQKQPVTQAGLSFTQVSWLLRADAPINGAIIQVTLTDNPPQTLTTSIVVLPTPIPTLTRTPRPTRTQPPTRTPLPTRTPTFTPTPCATTVTQPTCP